MSKQWISVAECLAEQQAMAALNDFSTAAGIDTSTPASLRNESTDAVREVASAAAAGNAGKRATSMVELQSGATAASAAISVKVMASCENGVSVFRVINSDVAWPDTGTFSIFRLDGPNRQQISARKMNMEAGDAKTFRVSKKQNLTGQIGFAIQPSWYERTFTMDSELQCR